MSKENECRAKDPATCPHHGAHVIAGQLYVYTKGRGFTISSEEVEIFTEDVLEVIKDRNNPDSDVTGLRDEKNIYEEWRSVHYQDEHRLEAPLREMVHRIAFLNDPDKTTLPEDNVLNPKKAKTYGGYNVAVGKMLAAEGIPVSPEDGYYGWSDYDMSTHIRECGIASVSTPGPTYWHEFNGTFNDDDDSKEGIQADAQCHCGNFKGKLRMESDTASLTRNLLDNYS